MKILKKKVNVFGKGIPLFIFALLGMFLVSGALVGYLSNTAESDVSVQSPLEIDVNALIYEGDGSLSLLDNGNIEGSIYGGESYTVQSTLKNLANAEITNVRTEIKVSRDGWMVDGEVTSLIFSDENGSWELIGLTSCIVGGDLYAYIGDSNGFNVSVGYVSPTPSNTTVTFAQNIEPGTEYSGESRVVGLSAVKC